MTYFAAPQFWWWGRGSLLGFTYSWNLWAALLLAITVGMHWSNRQILSQDARRSFFCLGLFIINAGLVHLLLADNPDPSWLQFDLCWKQTILAILSYYAVQDRSDLRIFLLALFIGCAYVGVEVVLREAGSIERGRLEGIRLPGASDSNGLSGLLTMGMMIAAYLFLASSSKWGLKIAVLLGSVLILEVLLRCNSRGAFLALIAGTGWLLFRAQGASRKKVLVVCLLGGILFLMQAKDVKIWERFSSIFVSAEERDASALGRIETWKAAVKMIGDYPFGSGGEAAFNSNRGLAYIAQYRDEFRAVHNGFLDIAAGWGVQGFLLFSLAIGFAVLANHRELIFNRREGTDDDVLLGATVEAVLVSQGVVAVFISSLDNEWFYWCITLLLLYGVCRLPEIDGDVEEAEAVDDFDGRPDQMSHYLS